MTETDLHWLAGLLEGEGCFLSQHNQPIVRVKMTDKDVIERAQKLMKASRIFYWQPQQEGWSATWQVQVSSHQAADLARMLFPLMGTRRQSKIKEILTIWDTRPVRNRKPRRSAEYEVIDG